MIYPMGSKKISASPLPNLSLTRIFGSYINFLLRSMNFKNKKTLNELSDLMWIYEIKKNCFEVKTRFKFMLSKQQIPIKNKRKTGFFSLFFKPKTAKNTYFICQILRLPIISLRQKSVFFLQQSKGIIFFLPQKLVGQSNN